MFDPKIDLFIEKSLSQFKKKHGKNPESQGKPKKIEKIAKSTENANLPRIPLIYVEGRAA